MSFPLVITPLKTMFSKELEFPPEISCCKKKKKAEIWCQTENLSPVKRFYIALTVIGRSILYWDYFCVPLALYLSLTLM